MNIAIQNGKFLPFLSSTHACETKVHSTTDNMATIQTSLISCTRIPNLKAISVVSNNLAFENKASI